MKKDSRNKDAIKTSIGGQALMEGIMMRGPKMTSMAVRRANGEMILEKWDTNAGPEFCPIAEIDSDKSENFENGVFRKPEESSQKPKGKFSRFCKKCSKIPFVRGIFNMCSSLSFGYKTLMRSADIAILDTPEDPPKEEKKPKKEGKKKKEEKEFDLEKASAVISVIGLVLGIGLSVLLFIMLPVYITKWLMKWMSLDYHSGSYGVMTIKSALEGFIKIIVLVLYMWAVSKMKDIRRTFMYHGAEHKTIFCYEQGLDLTVENVRNQRRFHPRCGTSFIVLTLLVSIIVGIFIPSGLETYLRFIIKLALLPVTMGISYELLKIAGRHDNIITRIFSAPGLWLQRITTVEPDDSMIECAIIAMKEVIPDDGSDRI